jgi:hypothetical protein
LKKQAGLSIDHRKAVIVVVTEAVEEIREIALIYFFPCRISFC